jgi:hypothetical protein
MTGKAKKRFGGAVDAAMEEVAKSSATSISVADAGTRESFLDAWARTLSDHAKYLRSSNVPLQAPMVVAYVADTGAFAGEHGQWVRRPMLGTSHRDNFAGILAVGTGGFGTFVYPTQLQDTEEFERQIRNAGLQHTPTISLVSNTKLLVWPDGIDGEPSAFERELQGSAVVIDLQVIDQELTRFYEVVARQTKKWWQNPSKRITVENPEAEVQYALWVFLMAKYSGVARVKTEDGIGNGRADITLIPTDDGLTNQSAVLELKTLREVRTPRAGTKTLTRISLTANIEWACSGVQQTASYCARESFDGAYLCLYDFRAGDSSDVCDAVTPYANQYGVLHRRYWITASHTEHMKDRFPITRKPITKRKAR